MSEERVRIEHEGPVATVTLNRPDKHNGIDWPMLSGLVEAAKTLRKARDTRVVILRGAGPSFCAGLDFPTFTRTPARIAQAFFQPGGDGANLFQAACLGWRAVPVPVIAYVHGNCFGGGLQLAAGCDFRIATADARLSIMESKWGLIPDMGGTVALRELLAMDQLKALAMTGEVIPARQALDCGLITRIGDEESLEAFVQQLLTRSPDALAATKFLFQETWLADNDAALASERRFQRRLLTGKNQRIAMQRNFSGDERPFRRQRLRRA